MQDRYQTLRTSVSPSGVRTLTLVQPDRLNAIDEAMHAELSQVFAEITVDPATRVVVITGEGRAFSSGGDLDWINGPVRQDPEKAFREAKKITDDLLNVSQPIIAAVHGAAAGFGLTMALLSDFSFVAEDAALSDPHVAIGLVAGDGGALTWPFLVGMARAKRYLLTGDTISGRQAGEWGLVTEALPADQVLPCAMEMAERMAHSSLSAVQGTKAALNASMRFFASLTLDLGLAAERVSAASESHAVLLAAAIQTRSARRDARRRQS